MNQLPRRAATSAPVAAAISAILFASVSVLFFYKSHAAGDIFQAGADPYASVWFLNWWPYALSKGLDPLYTHYIWEPIGFPLLWATSIPTLSFLTYPLSTTLGPITSWNFLSLAAPALNATAAFFLLYHLSRKKIPSIFGAYIFGFSPYVIGQALGHINLSFVALIPLLLLLVIRRAECKIARPVYVILLSFGVILQFGISTEITATFAFFGSLAFLLFFPFLGRQFDFRGLATDTLYAAALSAIILAPALRSIYAGSALLQSVIEPPNAYSADLLNYLIPTPTIRLGRSVFSTIAERFPGNYAEAGAYLGAPLILLTIISFSRQRFKPWSTPLLATLVGLLVCELGPWLWINGNQTAIPLPWQIFTHAPIIRHALPVRFSLYTALIISISTATWLAEDKLKFKQIASRYLLAALAIIFIIPNSSFFSWSSPGGVPDALTKKEINENFGKLPNLVVLSGGNQGLLMLWQMKSGMSFTMSGGYLGLTPMYFSKFPAEAYFLGAPLPSNEIFESAVRGFCRSNNVSGIIIPPNANNALREKLLTLRWKAARAGNTIVLKVPASAPSDHPNCPTPGHPSCST